MYDIHYLLFKNYCKRKIKYIINAYTLDRIFYIIYISIFIFSKIILTGFKQCAKIYENYLK